MYFEDFSIHTEFRTNADIITEIQMRNKLIDIRPDHVRNKYEISNNF